MNLKITKAFEKSLDILDLDSLLLLISILSQKAYVLNQNKEPPKPSPIIQTPTKLII